MDREFRLTIPEREVVGSGRGDSTRTESRNLGYAVIAIYSAGHVITNIFTPILEPTIAEMGLF